MNIEDMDRAALLDEVERLKKIATELADTARDFAESDDERKEVEQLRSALSPDGGGEQTQKETGHE